MVAREVAAKEIGSWLDYKRVKDRKRELYKDSIDVLVDAVCDGDLVVDSENFTLTQKLAFGTGGDEPVEELVFKPRIRLKDVRPHLQGVKADDADGRVVAYIAALTGQHKNVISALDTVESSIAQSIVVFFL